MRETCSPTASAISLLAASGVSVRYCKMSALRCSAMPPRFTATFLPPLFTAIFAAESGSVSVVRSGLNASTISGSCQPCFCQTKRILGRPLPARSPTFIKLNILMRDSLRGSDTPPTRASCTLMRKAPGFAIRILSGHF